MNNINNNDDANYNCDNFSMLLLVMVLCRRIKNDFNKLSNTDDYIYSNTTNNILIKNNNKINNNNNNNLLMIKKAS